MRRPGGKLFRPCPCHARLVTEPFERTLAMDISGKTTIVTGAASGIGLGTALPCVSFSGREDE